MRSVRRKPRLADLSRSDLSSASSATIAEPSPSKSLFNTSQISLLSISKPLPPPPSALVLGFRQKGFNAMVASPSSTSSARYHISVQMNCFMPSSYITVVRRTHEGGEFVSSFEMGISTQRAVVNMHGSEKFMDTVLSRTGKKTDERMWQWKWEDDPRLRFAWHRESPVRYCYPVDATGRPSGPMLAAFVVCSSTNTLGEASQQPASLTVYPEGQHIMDHILTSVLVAERKRLTPSPMTMKPIFN
ncbi:hypothetical protein PYCCODRAFT_1465509 [Trametes coccinea BRFM310]|uniref:DUF6593 domain-containing protein n=1 Tax=Trametes coccinea (strain BRFM310) TaxID=1353009 RepID=A0A1Y2IVD6_TRAC3|nr:hypothetical protein PYCCODRAFT_1465509 [Trametes coccinea BRFM310]